jgi:cell division protein FtsW
MVCSATVITPVGLDFSMAFRHAASVSMALAVLGICMQVDHRLWLAWGRPLALAALFLLMAVLHPSWGVEINGARRWFRLGGIGFQPSEPAKLAFLLYLADFVRRKRILGLGFWRGFCPPILIVGSGAALILLEPDFGSAVLLMALAVTVLWVGGLPTVYVTGFAVCSLPLVFLLAWIAPYRWERLITFINPWADPQGGGYQVIQSLLAYGSGGWTGVGLGAGKQKLSYLYASHSDFVLPVLAEELGLFGTLGVGICYAGILLCGVRLWNRQKDDTSALLVFTLVSWIVLQAILNMGVVMGALPPKGLPLPFVSYGGTSLVTFGAVLGILLNVARSRSPVSSGSGTI